MARLPWLAGILVPTLAASATFAAEAPATNPEVPQPKAENITNSTPPAAPPATATPAPVQEPDPTAAIVAEGRFIYRQRDIDALVQIASRHAKVKFTKIEEDVLRQALINAFIAREPLQDALSQLPASFTSQARDMLVLDILDYEAEPTKVPPPPETPTTAPDTATSTTNPPIAQGTTPPPPNAAEASGSLLIRLPPLALSRTLPAIGKRHLSLTIALFFRDRALAEKLQDSAPLVQDAILSYIQGLPPAQFAEPNQLTLKDGITAAIIAKVPDFPPDAVLIPEMDTHAPTTAAKPEK